MAGTELAISQLRQDSVYNRIYRKAIKKNTRIREIDEYLDTAAGEKEYDTWKKTHARNGYELGLDSVFVLAPSFYRIDATKKQQRIRWETSELLQDDFYSQIPAISSKKGLHIEMRDPNHYTSATQTPAYNEFMQLQQWVDEMIERPELVPSNQDEILILLKKYNIDHVTLFGAYSVKRNANLLLQGAIILTIVGPGVLIPSLMPVITYQLFKKRETGFLYMMVFDLQDPDLDFRTTHLTNYKVNELTSSKFLDFFIQQIKAKP